MSDGHESTMPLDLWGEPAEEMEVLQNDLLATAQNDDKRLAYMMYMLGRFQLVTGNHQAAAKTFLESYTLLPSFRPVLRTARRLYQQRGDHRLMVKLLGAEAAVSRDPATGAALLRRQAHLLWNQIGDPREARRSLEQARELSPEDPATLKLGELLTAAGDDAEALRAALQDHADVALEPRLRAALLASLALLGTADDPAATLVALREASKAAPNDTTVLCFLERVLEAERHHGELATVLFRQAEIEGSSTYRARLFARAARLVQRRLKNDGEAAALYARSLEAQPVLGVAADCFELLLRLDQQDEAARVGELLASLDAPRGVPYLPRRLADLHLQRGDADAALGWYVNCLESDPTYQPALEGAGRILEQRGDLEPLVELHRAELATVEDGPGRARRLHRLADLLERTGRLAEAVDVHHEALGCWPSFPPSVHALETLYRRLERWNELLQLHGDALEGVPEAQQAMAQLEIMADIWLRHLDQPDSALECLQGILIRDPDHLPALRAAARICDATGRWPELLELHEQEIALTESVGRRLHLLCRMGEVREQRLGDADGAADCFRRALELQADHAPALLALDRLYRARGAYAELLALLEGRLDAATKPRQTIALLYEVADIYDAELRDTERAAAAYRRVLDLDPSQHAAALALCEVHATAGRWDEVTHLLGGLEAAPADTEEEDLTDGDGTVRVPMVEYVTSDTELTASAEAGPLTEVGREEPTLRRTERMLRDSGLREELGQPLEARIAQTTDPVDLACLWTEAAEVCLLNEDGIGAEEAYVEALSYHGGHPTALWGLARLLEQQGRWSELGELAEQEAEAMESDGATVEALLRAAVISEERVEDTERAMELYSVILKKVPLHKEAFYRLRACHVSREDYGALASLLRTRISQGQDPRKNALLFRELGEIYVERLGQPGKGVACLRRALEMEPDELSVMTMLADMLYDRDEWDEAEQLYRRCLAAVEDAAERARLYRRRGEIHMANRKPDAALEALARAASSSSRPDAELLRLVATAAQAAGDASARIRAMEMLAQISDDRSERAAVHKELSQVAVEEMGDDTLALRSLEEALTLDPLDIEAIERVAAIHGSKGDRAAVSRHLGAAIDRHKEELTRDAFEVRIYQQLGRIFQWQREYDRFYCACVVRQYLEGLGKGVMEDAERRFLQGHHYRCSPIPTGTLAQNRYEKLILGPVADDPLRKVLVVARRGLQRRIANSPEALGLEPGSQIGPSHALHVLCDEIAALLGRPTFELRVSRTRPDLIAAEMLGAPVMILGEAVTQNLVTAAVRFRIGRALFLIAENALVLHDMSMRRIRVLLAALGEVASPPCPLAMAPTEVPAVKQEAARLMELVSEEERVKLGAVLPGLGGEVTPNQLAAFKREVRLAANRAGIVAGGDPQRCLEQASVLTEEEGGQKEMGDLLRFMVSKEYYKLRALLALRPEA